MSKSINSENSNSKFSLLSWLVRIILYSSVFASVFLPSYVAIEYLTGCPRSKIYSSKHWLGKTVQYACGGQIKTKMNVGVINRSQQAYHIEHNKFADSIAELELEEIKAETSSYSCRIVQPMTSVQYLSQSDNYDGQDSMRMAVCQRKIEENQDQQAGVITYNNYLGVVYTLPQTSASGETEIISRSAMCEMNEKNPLPTKMPRLINGDIECPKWSIKVNEKL